MNQVEQEVLNKLESIAWRICHLPNGKAATWFSPALRMAQYIYKAGDGDHLEIGVMHGPTLIMAALVKKEFNLEGTVIGVDPLEGYYPAGPLNPKGVYNEAGKVLLTKDDYYGTPINMEVLQKNIDYFNVSDKIEIVKKFSYPWPQELENSRFVSAYIDGDHYRDGPTLDWNNVHLRTEKYVMLDDCNEHCPAVQRARVVAVNTPGWHEIELFQDHLLVMERLLVMEKDVS